MSFLWWDFVLTSLSGAGEKGPFPKDIPDAQLSFSISGTPPPPASDSQCPGREEGGLSGAWWHLSQASGFSG